MRSKLYSSPDPAEVDEWFDADDGGGTHAVGVAVFVAERDDGSLAGFLEIGSRNYAEGCATSPVAYLEGWYVEPDARGSGLGRRLVEAAENWAMTRGYREMASDTQLGNSTSLKAHDALGYEEVERQICLMKRLRD